MLKLKTLFYSLKFLGPQGGHIVPNFATVQMEQLGEIHGSVGEQAVLDKPSGIDVISPVGGM